MKPKSLTENIKQNFPSGLVVFLVALPLCLGIALASGAPPLSGVIAGIIGGLVVGFISNSNISVSGPAAGLAAIVMSAITELGSFEIFLCAGIIAGVLQLVLGFIRAGSISNYFPNNVIEGMLAGIGIIIFIKQIPHALGYDKDYEGNETVFDHGYSLDTITDYFANLQSSIHLGAIIVTVASLVILLLWDNTPALKKIKLLPGALVAVLAGIGINQLFIAMDSSLAIVSSEHLVNLPVPKTLEGFKNMVTLPKFSGFLDSNVWILGATIAIVASIETLLCIEASDRLDVHRRITDTNLELKAQGIGNVLSALIGGLPMTSVVVRSSANSASGATTKLSAIIHGLLLLISILTIPFLLNAIPLATLAAILLVIGYKLANPKKFKSFFNKGWYQFIPFIATIVAIVATDLLKGVGIGLAISILFILKGNMKRAYYYSKNELDEANEVTIKLAEEVSFLNKAAIKKTLKNIHSNSKVIIDASNTAYITIDVLELIQDFANVRAKEDNIKVELIGFKTSYKDYASDQHSHIELGHGKAM